MNSLQNPQFLGILNISPPPKLPNPRKSFPFVNPISGRLTDPSSSHISLKTFIFPFLSTPLPSFAAEVDESSGKINIESILISIDDFFNRYPFFVAGVTFIWLVAIPLFQEYVLRKCKPIMAIDAYRKFRDLPNSQLLDIRKKKSFMFMDSPNLSIFSKNTVWMEFDEENEDLFVKEVLKIFEDPGNTVLCVLDNFDGNSLKVAELLFKNGFKEAYAIEGGLRGKDGWEEIQEDLLPPSVRVYPRKKKKSKKLSQSNLNSLVKDEKASDNDQALSNNTENGYVSTMNEVPPQETSVQQRPLSPYPNYSDLKPPSSPTPSKPQT
ncbi:rhodanese-like domain-containing protein 4A, chloroplastic [Dioscorea cayenensis subsp. rotundata]|uniref:Rhodanese-like domain-containing protein 4A, chloroplastic n=1 Tax=Dioscorea cayennensis subsp. rotundata TaxID=55577 RepID=A0AB40B1Q6_DIOCR|nr:rhodanese-like domain-containing protein 4A, chloroplastic [Dioscorea cayenensis subsp. rotundata]